MQAMVILEDAVIARLARDPAMVEEFPFLNAIRAAAAAPKARGCGKCGSKNKPTVNNYATIRQAIGNLSRDRKSRLKQLLNTTQVRVYFVNEKNQRVKLTF